MHAKLIVSRKMADNSRLISPMTNHRGSNTGHSQKFGQFDRLNFTERCGKAFDRTFNYERELSETFQYRKVMLNGSAHESADMIVVDRNQALQHNKREKKDLTQQPEIKSRQEQQKKKGSGF